METRNELSTTCNPKVMSRCLSAPDATSLYHCFQNHRQYSVIRHKEACSQPIFLVLAAFLEAVMYGCSIRCWQASRYNFWIAGSWKLIPISVLFREAFSHPYISFFHLLVNSFSVTSFRTFWWPLTILILVCVDTINFIIKYPIHFYWSWFYELEKHFIFYGSSESLKDCAKEFEVILKLGLLSQRVQ